MIFKKEEHYIIRANNSVAKANEIEEQMDSEEVDVKKKSKQIQKMVRRLTESFRINPVPYL